MWFHTDAGVVTAVDGVTLQRPPGEVFGIVGESGSGKSVTAMTILGLIPMPPGRVESGTIMWKGEDLLTMSEERLREVRGKEISMIFQDPMTSLNPVYTIGQQIAEIVRVHNDVEQGEAADPRHRHAEARRHPAARGSVPTTTRTSSRAACASGR